MRLCLMVEGQEDVSWDEWLALADACERAGLDGLFRSDHYLSVIGRRERAVARCDRDAGGTGGADGAHPAGDARLAGHVPASVGAREVGGDDRPRVGRTRRARARRRVERGRARRLRLRLSVARHAHGVARGTAGDRPPLVDRGLGDVHGPALSTGRLSGAAEAAATAAAAAHPRWQRQAEGGGARSTARRRVQHAARVDRRLPRAEVGARGGVRVRGARPRDTAADADGDVRRGGGPGRSCSSACAVCSRSSAPATRIRRPCLPSGGSGGLPGTPDEVVERLAALAEAGVERVYLQHLAHKDTDMVELIGEAVLPALAG